MFSIGKLKIEIPFILAPMAGITDLPFRLIAREYGCPLAFTEMVNARGLSIENGRTLELLHTSPADRPLGVQLLGRQPAYLREALAALEGYTYDIVDLNAACPVKKVIKKGEGAALLKEPETLARLVKTLADHAAVPVTVKIRTGWDDTSINASEIAKRLCDAGADALCVHGRTRQQAYRGKADYEIIRKVKQAVSIPVIASGDIFTVDAARGVLEMTGCDAVLVARGALGNPWIFRELRASYQGNGSVARPGRDEIAAVMRRHLALSLHYDGDALGTLGFRKCFIWYTRGLKNAKALRVKAVQMTTGRQMGQLIDELESVQLPDSSLPAFQPSPYDPHPVSEPGVIGQSP